MLKWESHVLQKELGCGSTITRFLHLDSYTRTSFVVLSHLLHVSACSLTKPKVPTDCLFGHIHIVRTAIDQPILEFRIRARP